jgi:hypothetical protein
MAVKFLRGPWSIKDGCRITALFEGEEVQILAASETCWSHPDLDKNQRLREYRRGHLALTSALPEMYEACELIVRANDIANEKLDLKDNEVYKVLCEALEAAQAALEKVAQS